LEVWDIELFSEFYISLILLGASPLDVPLMFVIGSVLFLRFKLSISKLLTYKACEGGLPKLK
jgi:hypothetical protein